MSSDPTDINENPTKGATEIYYPDGGDDAVVAGLPPKPSARPDGYADKQAKTGIPFGVEPDDLPGMGSSQSHTRKTLGDYLHKQTDANITPVPKVGSLAGALLTPITSELANIGQAFIPTSEINPNSTDPEYNRSNEVTYGPGGSADKLLHNVEQDASSQGGAYDNPDSEYAGTSVGQVSPALAVNRFAPGRPFDSSQPQNWMATQRMDGNQPAPSLGKYNKKWDGLALQELTSVAEQLLLRGIGDDSGQKPGEVTYGGSVTDFGKAAGFPFIGGLQNTGLKRANSDLDFNAGGVATAVKMGKPKNTDNNMGAMATYSDPLSTSKGRKDGGYTVLNNHLEQFTGAFPTSMILVAAVAAISVLVVALVIAALLDLLGLIAAISPEKNIGDGLNPRPAWQIYPDGSTADLPMGQAFGTADFSDTKFFSTLYKWMGIPTLDASYDGKLRGIRFIDCTITGALEFFIGNSLNGGNKLAPQIVTNAAGYYACVTRNAIRDWDQVSDAWNTMGDGGGFNLSAVEGFFNMIEAFKSSGTFRFTMVMVMIGDRIKCGPGLMGNRDNGGIGGLPEVMPENNPEALITAASLHSMVRMRSTHPRLSYAFSNLPQVYLRPKEAFKRTDAHGFQKTLTQTRPEDNDSKAQQYRREIDQPPDVSAVGLADFIPKSDIIMGNATYVNGPNGEGAFVNRLSYFENGRINTSMREAIESELDTYYVPFYFHDMRTNEILPLPCFVSDISDSFTPNWKSISTFGRADPVQIYGGTSRKIGFSFYMVATSKDDYNALWYGINKLVSLVYPQWGGARSVTNAKGQTFTVPFSSIPTSSPLIRLRLGELFASNRAPETVRRLFGANRSDFSVGEDPATQSPIAPTKLEPGEPTVNENQLKVIHARKHLTISGDAVTLIGATQIFNLGGEAKFFNAAGANWQGKGGATVSGGEAAGKSALLPAGCEIDLVGYNGMKLRTACWNLIQYETPRGPKLKVPEGHHEVKILNYWTSGKTKDGKNLKDFYYVCEPIGEAITGENWKTVEKKAKKKTGASAVYLLIPPGYLLSPKVPDPMPSPLPLPPWMPQPPQPEIITDKSFFQDNLIVEAMREAGGMGLAGAITQLDFNWNEAPWETSKDLGRAPQFVRVAMSFSPIHDEPLGLNSDGSLRAAAYPVGDTIQQVMGKRFELPGYYEGASLAALQQAIADAKEALEESAGPGADALEG